MEWKVVVANTGEDSITFIDLKRNYKKENISLLSLLNRKENMNLYLDSQPIGPWDLVKGSIENKIYLANAYNNSIFKLDINKMEIEDVLVVGKYPTTIKYYNGFVFVLNEDSNSISIVDEKKFRLIENISVGDRPKDMEIYRPSEKIFVANNNSYSIDIIDIINNKNKRIKLSNNPIKLCLEKKYMYILSYSNGGFSDYSNISVFSLESLKIVKSLDIEGIFSNMVKIKGDIFFLTSLQDGHMYKMDLGNNKIIKKIYLDGMPNKIFWDGNKLLFITNISKDILTIFNISNNKIIKNIKVGSEPNGIVLIK
ncbi:hypothetical protein NSA23_14615 [Anaerosalibacter massiliensis]|uniref:Uncharacterized protein n=1 Tax=Anaerosalibacter massiliensis TaxID=1347392 RepID=A0A9X2MJT0_9FIRM|nr:hypothetical protein [Anaerosalibacter massiliensis]MCR2045333.1 hypothetical protein [Anaerosalibacter massiliensis]